MSESYFEKNRPSGTLAPIGFVSFSVSSNYVKDLGYSGFSLNDDEGDRRFRDHMPGELTSKYAIKNEVEKLVNNMPNSDRVSITYVIVDQESIDKIDPSSVQYVSTIWDTPKYYNLSAKVFADL